MTGRSAIPTVDAATLAARLAPTDPNGSASGTATPGGDRTAEIAVLDAREEGVFATGHLFRASSVPLSHLELVLEELVPRRSTPVVWCDDGTGDPTDGPDGGLAQRAAARATALGWTDCSVLAGGTTAWAAAGQQLYRGVNVPSKAFGELVERAAGTPGVSARELAARLERGDDLVVLDARPPGEFRRRSIPGGIDCPGAELVHRIREVAPDPATTVVVNCAGRTRSIIGAQSLLDAGVENPVLALENGTMGWQLAGLEVATGAEAAAPGPGPEARAWARNAVAGVAGRFEVPLVPAATVREWRSDPGRTTYLFDVRSDDEFTAGHLSGAVHAPGGQLVQATDSYAATLGARIVTVDDDETRAVMTAAWLRRQGWDAGALAGGIEAAAGGRPLATGPQPRPQLARVSAPVIRPPELHRRLADDADPVTVIDIGTSLKYRRRGHIAGSWWAVRSRLDQARQVIGEAGTVVLTSTDGTLARLAVADAATHWPEAEVVALAAGNKGWRHAGFDMEPGFERATTTADDVYHRPYDHTEEVAERMSAYLTWEVGLVARVERDPLVSFPFGLLH